VKAAELWENVCIDVDGARSLHAGEGGHWIVAARRSGKRALATKFSALATKFSAHKASLLDINGDKVSYSRFDLPTPRREFELPTLDSYLVLVLGGQYT
jgi:hypothetical protein